MRRQNRHYLFYPAITVGGGRVGYRKVAQQRRRLGLRTSAGWQRYPSQSSRLWWPSPQSPASSRGLCRDRSAYQGQIDGPTDLSLDSGRYHQESIDLNEDSILSEELLEALNRPLAGGSIRPLHALATSRISSRPAYHNRPRARSRVRKIEVS